MAKREAQEEKPGSWIIRGVPRNLMKRMKIAAAIEGISIRQLLFDISDTYLKTLEKKGLLPKGK